MIHRSPAALLARIESLIWDGHDEAAKAAGFSVVRTGRWQRRYRHPRITVALAAAAAREADELAAPLERAVRSVPAIALGGLPELGIVGAAAVPHSAAGLGPRLDWRLPR